MTPAATQRSPLAGIACVSAGVMFLTISDATAKLLGEHYSPPQILFLRALIALPIVLLVTASLGGRRALRTQHPWLHLTRGAINVVSAGCFYLGLAAMPLAEATAISYAAPMFVTALSVLLLKERVDGPRWLAVAAGFAGVLVIVQPGSASFQPAALLPLTTAVLYAVMMITARAIGSGEGMLTTMFYIVAAQLVASAVLAPWFWSPVQLADLPRFGAVAVFSTLGLTFITQGFRIGPASVVAPYDYTGLLWATLLGWLIWRDAPGLAVCVGAIFIAGSGVYIAWREARPRQRRAGRAA
ncbi:DMT family transporter [Bordetella genomosp. 13]|uniref:DMT family transporter n=1 Tax=Bordetella genomosp. 13 TaxID=463040 RepID=UPI0021B56D94|nr:DMT family transporter [Bordetella genomosp. 13]